MKCISFKFPYLLLSQVPGQSCICGLGQWRYMRLFTRWLSLEYHLVALSVDWDRNKSGDEIAQCSWSTVVFHTGYYKSIGY